MIRTRLWMDGLGLILLIYGHLDLFSSICLESQRNFCCLSSICFANLSFSGRILLCILSFFVSFYPPPQFLQRSLHRWSFLWWNTWARLFLFKASMKAKVLLVPEHLPVFQPHNLHWKASTWCKVQQWCIQDSKYQFFQYKGILEWSQVLCNFWFERKTANHHERKQKTQHQ